MNGNCSYVLDLRNLQEQVKKAFCYQILFWPFTVSINCCSNLKNFANSRPSALNFKGVSQSLEQFFLTVGQNNFANKIPFHIAFQESHTENWAAITTFYRGVNLGTNSRTGIGSMGVISAVKDAWILSVSKIPQSSGCLRRSWSQVKPQWGPKLFAFIFSICWINLNQKLKTKLLLLTFWLLSNLHLHQQKMYWFLVFGLSLSKE